MIDYDRIVTDYAQYRQVHPEVLRSLVKNLQPTSRVLEVGCGTGNYIVAIQELVGCSCWGIDPSNEMLSMAGARSGQIHLQRGQAEDLDFPSSSFDFVFSADVIHHVGDRGQFFREAWRVLRHGGRMCTVTDSEWIIRHRQPLSAYFPQTVAVDLARYPRINDLRASMQKAGFADIEEEMVELPYELNDIGPYRAKAFSCLRLIPKDAFQQGIERMGRDIVAGPIPCVSRYTLVWGAKLSPAE